MSLNKFTDDVLKPWMKINAGTIKCSALEVAGVNVVGGSVSGISDHTLLSNIGVKTHIEIDNFIASKSQINGLAPLDSLGKIPQIHIPVNIEFLDAGTEYLTFQQKPIKNDTLPTDPKHLVHKDYVDNLNLSLQQKTQYLDTTGKLTGNLLPINDNVYDIGDVNTRVRNIYANGNVMATSFRGTNIVNPIANAGISINSSGNISIDIYDASQDGKILSLQGGVLTPVDVSGGSGGFSEKIYTGFTASQSGGGTSNTITIYATKYNRQVTLNIPEMTISTAANANHIISIQTNELPLLGSGEYVVAVLIGNQLAFCRLKNNVGATYLEFTLHPPTTWSVNQSSKIQPFTISYPSINNTSLGGGSTIWGTVPAFITPHNLTNNDSNGDFIVTGSSTGFNDVGNYGPWRCFDNSVFNGHWGSGVNTYDSNGDQTTGALGFPSNRPGTWIAVTFLSNKIISTIVIQAEGTTSFPRDFWVFRKDTTTNSWVDTGFAVTNTTLPAANGYASFIIPEINGGGNSNWRGIALVISRIHPADVYNNVYIKELDFQ